MQQRSVPALDTVSASRKRKLLASVLAVPLVSGLTLSEARAADAYWDTNADTAGAGTNPGTWGLDAFWTTDATGSTTPTNAWTADDLAIFSAGDDLTGAYTVNVTATQAASGIRFENGDVTLAGGQINLSGDGTIEVGTPAATINSVLGGPIGFTKTGAGTLTLTGVNTYSGVTTFSGGTTSISSSANLGDGSGSNGIQFLGSSSTLTTTTGITTGRDILLGAFGTINVSSGQSTTLSGVISGNSGLFKAGTGTLTLSGINQHTALTGVMAGTLVITNNASLGTNAGATSVTSGATLEVPGGLTINEQAQLAGAGVGGGGALRKTGPGTTTWTGGMSAASGTRINVDEGTLVISSNPVLISSGQNLTLGGAGNITQLATFSASGTNRIIKDGTGTLTLGGVSSITGGVTINGGVVSFAADGNAGATSYALGRYPASVSPGYIILNGGTLQSTHATDGGTFVFPNRGIQVGPNGGTIDVATPGVSLLYGGVIGVTTGTTNGTLTKTGPGELRVSANQSFAKLVVDAGTYRSGTEAGFGAVPGVETDDAITLRNGASISHNLANLTLAATRGITLGTGGGGINHNGGATTVQGKIKGAGALIKNMTGTLVLNGDNSYAGGTTLTSGTIAFNHNNAAGTGDITVTPAAASTVSNSGAGLTTTLANNVVINPGAATFSVLAPAGNTLALNGVISGAGGWTAGALNGDLVLGGAGPNTFSGNVTVSTGTLRVAKNDALGTTAGTTTVITGGALAFAGDIAYTTAEPVTINGTGVGDTGAIRSVSGNNTFGGPVTLASDSSIGADAGTLALSGGVNGGFALSKVGAGDVVAKHVKIGGALSVNAGNLLITPNGGADGMVQATGLSIASGAALRLNDNDLMIDYTDTSPEAAIRQLVKDARVNGSTSGIFSTPGDPDDDVVLAVADNAAWGKSTFNDVSIDTSTVIGKYTYFGDANLDGKVTGDDYLNVDANLGTGDSWLEGDFNSSGTTTGDDYLAIDANLGKGTANPLAFAELKAEMVALHVEMFGEGYLVKLAQVEAGGFGAVPEPGVLSTLGIGLFGLLSRRRRGSGDSPRTLAKKRLFACNL